mmetsp:Transcript_35001/g.58846  ORF Transcript_35001/g.58846 Transcript_35001/m.58846 type:complete len:253 (+) Transcript_35001:387-1145(+)
MGRVCAVQCFGLKAPLNTSKNSMAVAGRFMTTCWNITGASTGGALSLAGDGSLAFSDCPPCPRRCRTKARPHIVNTLMRCSTLFSLALMARYLVLSGLRSFANTVHPLSAAGTANGPMPAIMSHTTVPDLLRYFPTKRACSFSKREFQYTSPKSNLNTAPCCLTSVSRDESPAMTSNVGTRKVFAIVPTLLTMVRMRGPFLSKSTFPMTDLYGNNSSRKLRCATWPMVSKEPGTSTPAGRTCFRICSAVKYS